MAKHTKVVALAMAGGIFLGGTARAQQAMPPAPPALRLASETADVAAYRNTGLPAARRQTTGHGQRPGVRGLAQPPAMSAVPERPPALPRLPEPMTASIDTPASTVAGRGTNATEATQGLRAGAFLLRGELEIGGLYTTRRGDEGGEAFGLRVAPDLRLVSNWPRHELRVDVRGEFITYDRGKAEAGGEMAVALRLDARRDTRLRLALSDSVDRVESDDAASGIQHEVDASATLEHERYRLTLAATAGVLRHMEPDAAQDYWQPHASVRLRLRTSPMLAVYGEMGGDVRRFDESGDNRDSRGGYVEVGAELLAGPVWEGRMGLRASGRDYRDPATENLHGIGINGELTWRPTRAATLRLEATLDLQDESDGRSRTQTVALSWRQQLRRDLESRARLEVENNDAQNGDDSRVLRLSASLAWQVWRKLAIVASYGLERDISGGASDSATEHRLGLGLRRTF